MQITFNTNDSSDRDILKVLFSNLNSLLPEQSAQPEVATNTGTTGSGLPLSPEASGVSEPVADPAPAAPVKKTRAKKEAVEQVEKPVDTESSANTAATEATAGTSAKPLTLDEVRAALQQYTASKGVPAGIELLKKFGAGRISELDADNYASFVAECAA